MPAGAPKKPADPDYPKRAATRAAARDTTDAARAATISAAETTTIGVIETPETAPEPTESSYICNTCESPLSRTDAGCPVCKCSLDWSNL